MEFAQKTSRGPGFSPRPLSCSPFPSLLCQNILSGFPADSMDHARNIPQAVFHGAEPVAPHQLLRAGAVPGLDGLKDFPMLGNGNLSQPVTVEIMVFDPLDMEDHGVGKFLHILVVCPADNRVMEEAVLRDRIGAVITAAGIHKGGVNPLQLLQFPVREAAAGQLCRQTLQLRQRSVAFSISAGSISATTVARPGTT